MYGAISIALPHCSEWPTNICIELKYALPLNVSLQATSIDADNGQVYMRTGFGIV
jgi:hypothetical protein